MPNIDNRLVALLEPVVEATGFELVHVEHIQGGDAVLRVYIDAPGGIELADCEKVSREISALLDVEDPLPGAYHLEVSSPGLDRPLIKPVHFERFAGEEVRVLLRDAYEGRRKYTGTLEGISGDTVTVHCGEITLQCTLDEIEQARLVPRYSL